MCIRDRVESFNAKIIETSGLVLSGQNYEANYFATQAKMPNTPPTSINDTILDDLREQEEFESFCRNLELRRSKSNSSVGTRSTKSKTYVNRDDTQAGSRLKRAKLTDSRVDEAAGKLVRMTFGQSGGDSKLRIEHVDCTSDGVIGEKEGMEEERSNKKTLALEYIPLMDFFDSIIPRNLYQIFYSNLHIYHNFWQGNPIDSIFCQCFCDPLYC
eukprot:TRINITY_DN5094_c0_g2_i1.p2 TRINITY_DN5094_c0_g2~~TRINITY_DN5094_c0_g2_i1.p2  ORF type:complete len:214 (-),score=14.01 TRINITY_DN5094_c0_g2_i1:143-784(-)